MWMQVQVYDGAAWRSVVSGVGSNVVQAVKTGPQSSSIAAGAQAAVSDLSATITPSSDTSKVLVVVQLTGTTSTSGWYAKLKRGSTEIFLGDAAGSRGRASTSAVGALTTSSDLQAMLSVIFLDSPATDSAVTYSVDVSHRSAATATVYINRSEADLNAVQDQRTASSITAIEVAA
jgi:hypothetical protein